MAVFARNEVGMRSEKNVNYECGTGSWKVANPVLDCTEQIGKR